MNNRIYSNNDIKYKNHNDFVNLIRNTLLSIDASIFNFIKLHNEHNLYSIIKFNNDFTFNNLISLLNSILSNNIHFEIFKNYKNYFVIQFKYSTNDILLYLHLYTMNIYTYIFNTVETFFDINSIIMNYYCYSIIPNFQNINYTYDIIIQRIYNKKFCYISNDMNNLYLILKDNSQLQISIEEILNKIIYASKLIINDWIMDEYLNSNWTINYFKIYRNYLNLIKFNNSSCIINNCDNCDKIFFENDIVFNIKDIFIHYNCLFDKLYSNLNT